tara:strand:- start:952 stop:1113 length:162 start_codon:yes stop_codon:yes gene_type:complete
MRSKRTKHIMNEKDEIRRVDREIRENEGYKKGGKTKRKSGGKTTKRKSGGRSK